MFICDYKIVITLSYLADLNINAEARVNDTFMKMKFYGKRQNQQRVCCLFLSTLIPALDSMNLNGILLSGISLIHIS